MKKSLVQKLTDESSVKPYGSVNEACKFGLSNRHPNFLSSLALVQSKKVKYSVRRILGKIRVSVSEIVC